VHKDEEAAPETDPLPPEPPAEVVQEASEPAEADAPATSALTALDSEVWPQILHALKQTHNTLYGVVRMAEPVFLDDGNMRLNFAFAFHQKRINEPTNRQILVNIIQTLTGERVNIECVFKKDARPLPQAAVTKPAPSTEELHTISNIFGGGELI
jgi:hypothetical protein